MIYIIIKFGKSQFRRKFSRPGIHWRESAPVHFRRSLSCRSLSFMHYTARARVCLSPRICIFVFLSRQFGWYTRRSASTIPFHPLIHAYAHFSILVCISGVNCIVSRGKMFALGFAVGRQQGSSGRRLVMLGVWFI